MTPAEFHALPTPRTDAFYWKRRGINPEARHANEWQEFARQLEREVALLERALKDIHLDGSSSEHRIARETLQLLKTIRSVDKPERCG